MNNYFPFLILGDRGVDAFIAPVQDGIIKFYKADRTTEIGSINTSTGTLKFNNIDAEIDDLLLQIKPSDVSGVITIVDTSDNVIGYFDTANERLVINKLTLSGLGDNYGLKVDTVSGLIVFGEEGNEQPIAATTDVFTENILPLGYESSSQSYVNGRIVKYGKAGGSVVTYNPVKSKLYPNILTDAYLDDGTSNGIQVNALLELYQKIGVYAFLPTAKNPCYIDFNVPAMVDIVDISTSPHDIEYGITSALIDTIGVFQDGLGTYRKTIAIPIGEEFKIGAYDNLGTDEYLKLCATNLQYISIDTFFRFDGVFSSYNNIVDEREGDDVLWKIGVDGNGQIIGWIYAYDEEGNVDLENSVSMALGKYIKIGEFNHIAICFSNDVGNNYTSLEIYINGTDIGTIGEKLKASPNPDYVTFGGNVSTQMYLDVIRVYTDTDAAFFYTNFSPMETFGTVTYVKMVNGTDYLVESTDVNMEVESVVPYIKITNKIGVGTYSDILVKYL